MFRFGKLWVGMVVSAGLLAGCSGNSNPTYPGGGNGGSVLLAKWSGSDGIGEFAIQHCTPCHITAPYSGNGYNLSTYATAMTGGRITPGDGTNSYIIKKLLGTGPGARMPNGGPYLSTAQIDTIRAWIDAGAQNN